MKRLFFFLAFLLLPWAAFGQTTINVSVVYTPGAAAAATAAGTTVPAKVANAIGVANGFYSSSTINITLVAITVPAVGAPADSAPMQTQFNWVRNDPSAWQSRTNADASITVLVSDAQGQTGATVAAAQPAAIGDSVAVVPYSILDYALESAISKIIGSTNGYSARLRSYPTDPILLGQNYCYHTRESTITDPNTQVPFLPYWIVYTPGQVNPVQQTTAPTAAVSCTAYKDWYRANGQSTFTTGVVTGNACVVYDNNNQPVASGSLSFNSNPGSSAISCSENAPPSYSKNGIMAASPYLSLGNGATDSVTPMNIRAPIMVNWPNSNALILSRKKASLWNTICFGWLCDL